MSAYIRREAAVAQKNSVWKWRKKIPSLVPSLGRLSKPILKLLDNWNVPGHLSFLLKIKITMLDIFNISLSFFLSLSLSLPLSHSLSLSLSLFLSLFLSLSDWWRGCVHHRDKSYLYGAHPCKHKACQHSKCSSFIHSVSQHVWLL